MEIRPISLPTNECNKCWFTCLRFIHPILDQSLHAFRLLDTHYLWSKADIVTIVDAIVSWEASGKRCQIWKFRSPNCMRPFAGGSFGLNLALDSVGVKICYDIDFLQDQLILMFFPRIDIDLSTIAYGDDEWMIYLLIMFYFRDSKGGVDESKVYYLSEHEHSYYATYKRYHVSAPEKWAKRYAKVTNFIDCHDYPHLLTNIEELSVLYR